MDIRKKIREFIFSLSIIVILAGTVPLIMGINGIWFPDFNIIFLNDVIEAVGNYIAYVFVAGIIVESIGLWYLYDFLMKRKKFLEGIDTDKRSEFLKKHVEVEEIAKKLPSKYQKILDEKEKVFRIK